MRNLSFNIDHVLTGRSRLSDQQALELYHNASLHDLGQWAHAVTQRLHPEDYRTYVIDRNINYTNVCTAKCTFCAFRRDGDEDDAYTLETDALLHKIQELTDIGGTQILMQGGMNPDLPLEWYTDLLRAIKQRFPRVHVHAFSPPEFVEFVRFFNPPGGSLREQLMWVMQRLKEAGLDSVPGGGGEIFAPHVRRKIGLGKCDAEQWLTVMRVAHELGMNTSATMMFGHIEGIADRIHHMELVRQWQDRSIADFAADGGGRYKAFIAWPFQRENTPLGRCKEWGQGDGDDLNERFAGDEVADEIYGDLAIWQSGDWRAESNQSPNHQIAKSPNARFGRRVRMAGSTDYLRTQAISRLYLDNIYSIGSSWVTMGPHIGQVALHYGASDMGSVMMEENVVSAAGTTYCLNEPMLCRLIRDAGFIPAQRNNEYNLLKVHDDAAAPDRQVTDWSTLRAQSLHVQTKQEAAEPISLTVSAAAASSP
jgi:cyclic dehypoxanthinyl futalosine synthase